MHTKRQAVVNTFDDLLSDFFYYDRKEDEELRTGDIETLLESDRRLADDLIRLFRRRVKEQMDAWREG